MKRIAIIFLGLLLITCGAESPTSPQAVAGIYTLQAVTIDSGSGRTLDLSEIMSRKKIRLLDLSNYIQTEPIAYLRALAARIGVYGRQMENML